jgi:hypothetical protein
MIVNYENLKVYLNVISSPRPAPECRNPDSPAFSDCGDDGEFEIVEIEIHDEDNGNFAKVTEGIVLDMIIERLHESNRFIEKVWEEYSEQQREKFYE